MVCDALAVEQDSEISGVIRTEGRLVDEGEVVLARFQQQVRVTRGDRLVEIVVELEPLVTDWRPGAGHYLCSRWAWKHDSEELIRGVQGLRVFASGQWNDSPAFIEWVGGTERMTLLPNGLPFHRRSSSRTLDTLLVTAGETETRFRFGIGFGLRQAEAAARRLQCPVETKRVSRVASESPLPVQLLKLDRQNVQITWSELLCDPAGKVIGVSVRLLETQGRSGQLRILADRTLSSAARVSFDQRFLSDLETQGKQVVLNFQSFEYMQIQLNWD